MFPQNNSDKQARTSCLHEEGGRSWHFLKIVIEKNQPFPAGKKYFGPRSNTTLFRCFFFSYSLVGARIDTVGVTNRSMQLERDRKKERKLVNFFFLFNF
jgi:hypothetical protein